jgi:hypothetical protein
LERFSPQQSLANWQSGKRLEEAVWEFCDPEIRNVIPQTVQNAYWEWRKMGNSESYNEAIADECDSYAEFELYSQQVDSEISDMLQNVYEKIISGELIAFGFQFPIESEFPSQIPIYMWPPDFEDRDKSEIESNGIKFVKIRIIESSFLNQLKNIPNLEIEEIKDKPVGRPSKRQKIIDAYLVLKQDEKIDYSKTFKSHIQAIRDTVRYLNPNLENDKGLGAEAIRRTVKPLFDQEKEDQK